MIAYNNDSNVTLHQWFLANLDVIQQQDEFRYELITTTESGETYPSSIHVMTNVGVVNITNYIKGAYNENMELIKNTNVKITGVF